MEIAIITTCLTGEVQSRIIASIFKSKAEMRGHIVHRERQSSIYIKERLLDLDIERSDVVVIAAISDVIEIDRFKSKKIVKVSLKDIVKDCDEVIDIIEKS